MMICASWAEWVNVWVSELIRPVLVGILLEQQKLDRNDKTHTHTTRSERISILASKSTRSTPLEYILDT